MSDLVLIKTSYGSLANTTAATFAEGTMRFTDTADLFADMGGKRQHISSLITGMTENEIKSQASTAILQKMYLSSDSKKLFWYVPAADEEPAKWVVIGGDHVALADLATRAINDADGNSIIDTYETKSDASAKKAELDQDIANLEATIAKINSFEVRKVDSVEDMPIPGKSNFIYFVPSSKSSTKNIYDEYIWIVDETHEYGGYYENIGTSEAALDDYYTKNQVDAIKAALEAADEALGTRITNAQQTLQGNIDTLEGTVTANKTASDAAEAKLTSDLAAQVSKEAADVAALEAADTTLQGNIDTLEGTVTANKAAADATQADLDILEADVATIHRWNTEFLYQLPAIDAGNEYTIYFIPENGLEGDTKKYAEYMYVPEKTFTREDPIPEDPEGGTITVTITIPAHYERIDSTVEFLNYYTKAEIDEKTTALQTNISTNTTNITNLSATVTANKKASDDADAALDERVTDLEEAIGSGSGTGTILARLAQAEQDIVDNKAATDAKDATQDGRLDAIEAVIGDGETEDTILNRIDTLETGLAAQVSKEAGDLADLQAADATLQGNIDTLEGTVTANKTASDAAELKLTQDLAAQVSKEATDVSNLEAADTALDEKIDGVASDLSDLTDTVTANKSTSDAAELKLTQDLAAQVSKEASDVATLQAADTALGGRIDDLSAEVATINRFDIKFYDSYEDLPEVGTKFVLYFVPTGEEGKYVEYMWIDADEETGRTAGYEEIDATSANLNNYYTKSQIDSMKATIEATIAANLTHSDGRDDGQDTRLDAIEAAIGTGSTEDTILKRIGDLETDLAAQVSKEASDVSALQATDAANLAHSDARDDGQDTRLDAIEAAIGDGSTEDTILKRIGTLETDLAAQVSKEATDVSDLQAADTTLQGNIDALASKEADDVSDLQGQVDDINTELDKHDWLYAGAATENGASIKVVETTTANDGYQDVLVANGDHDAVEYATGSKAQVNPATGNLKVESITLGGATLVYDENTESVVFNF